MLEHSCRLGSPVVFFEPKRLYWNRRRQERLAEPVSAFGARIVRRGSDVTVAGYGAVLEDVLAAADALAGTVDVEVIDLRWIAPMDVDAVLASVARTTRLLVVHEAVGFCGVGAELAATVAERAWHHLSAPVRRVAPPRHLSARRPRDRPSDRRAGDHPRDRGDVPVSGAENSIDIHVPDFGHGLTDALVVEWLVSVGDVVERGRGRRAGDRQEQCRADGRESGHGGRDRRGRAVDHHLRFGAVQTRRATVKGRRRWHPSMNV